MRAAKARTWTTAAAVAVFAVVATAWPAAAAPWPPADGAGVETTSPLLAPVDVELAPAPPAPAERAEITLALQPPRSWAGLLDLGVPSGETLSLSETRVWGFFLGLPDCVGLERLQVPDSTGDASFCARSLRHGVYFARNNPVGNIDPDGREAFTLTAGGLLTGGGAITIPAFVAPAAGAAVIVGGGFAAIKGGRAGLEGFEVIDGVTADALVTEAFTPGTEAFPFKTGAEIVGALESRRLTDAPGNQPPPPTAIPGQKPRTTPAPELTKADADDLGQPPTGEDIPVSKENKNAVEKLVEGFELVVELLGGG